MSICKVICCGGAAEESKAVYVEEKPLAMPGMPSAEEIEDKKGFPGVTPAAESKAVPGFPVATPAAEAKAVPGVPEVVIKDAPKGVPVTDTANVKETSKQGVGLKLTFKDKIGSKKSITFTQAPMGLTFEKALPLEITSVNDEAARYGVQVGWTILSINDQAIESSGMTYAECFQLMKVEMAKLPIIGKVAKIVFQTADGEVTTLFTRRPLGLTIEGFPLTVASCKAFGEAAQKSVKPGWKILSVNDQDLTKSPLDQKTLPRSDSGLKKHQSQKFEAALKVFQKVVNELPSSPAVGA